MPATFAAQHANGYSSDKFKVYSVTLDSNYPTGGYPISAADMGMTRLNFVIPGIAVASGFMLIPVWDFAAQTIRVFYPTGGATAAPSTVAAPLSTTGGSTASAVNATTPAITPGAGKEVPSGANLSAFAFQILAVGS